MNERHLSFTAIRELLNEYEIENGLLYLRIKPILLDVIADDWEREPRFRCKFTYTSIVIKSSKWNPSEFGFSRPETSKKNEERELEFRPVKEVINIYETEGENIILLAYVLDKIVAKNELDSEGVPFLHFVERNFIEVVPRPDRTRRD
jgi:hypothetical protein